MVDITEMTMVLARFEANIAKFLLALGTNNVFAAFILLNKGTTPRTLLNICIL